MEGKKLWKRAANAIPGGNGLLSKRPDRYVPDFWPTYFSKAKGIKVWDMDGKEFIIPYGTCELDNDGCLSHINEKPQFDLLTNTGLYILNPNMLELLPKNKFYDLTHLIEDAKNQGKKVGVFPIGDDAWIDVGQWAEYKKAIDLS